jgi:hypothetical protein
VIALEAMLGYSHGDEVSGGVADALAAQRWEIEVGTEGILRRGLGTFCGPRAVAAEANGVGPVAVDGLNMGLGWTFLGGRRRSVFTSGCQSRPAWAQ